MTELFKEAIAWYNLPITALLVLVVLYWFVAALGVLGDGAGEVGVAVLVGGGGGDELGVEAALVEVDEPHAGAVFDELDDRTELGVAGLPSDERRHAQRSSIGR